VPKFERSKIPDADNASSEASLHANGNGNGNGNGFGNIAGEEIVVLPDFLTDSELPAGLVNNPSQVIGVDLKPGKKPAIRKAPDLTGKKATIRGLDNKPIHLDLTTSERINIFHPDQYTVIADGTYVGEGVSKSRFYHPPE
jgi:hypothetical protein